MNFHLVPATYNVPRRDSAPSWITVFAIAALVIGATTMLAIMDDGSAMDKLQITLDRAY